MSNTKFKVDDVSLLNSKLDIKMYVNNVKSSEPITIVYLKTGLVKASPDFITKLFELSKD
ncbi:hypothetical protein [Chryseobacterium sp. RR2-3-20]|uniref:hypothetical protein n=1 Tax=Chryseobacterium sp. RR2-3-20 TaxID=2787626 RepID=UPI001ADF3B94|nr:hypothetical protein [Chryseobacterium sp. RR2-3-20]